jgi:anti-sigma B factor antagonist
MESRLGAFHRRDRHRVACLVVDGDIDDRRVDRLTDAIFEAVCDAHASVVLDLTGVTSFGPGGIGSLITAAALAHDHGVELTIHPSRTVQRVLEISGLADFLGLPAHAA